MGCISDSGRSSHCCTASTQKMKSSSPVQHAIARVLSSVFTLLFISTGLIYTCPTSAAIAWMPHRKGLINGVIVCGFGPRCSPDPPAEKNQSSSAFPDFRPQLDRIAKSDRIANGSDLARIGLGSDRIATARSLL